MIPKPDIILHPVRIRIIFALQGRQMTPQQIGRTMPDVAPATLYRHLKTLLASGVLSVVAQRPVHGTLERVYALVHDAANLTSEDMAGATREQHQHYFNVFVSGLLGQFHQYLQQKTVRGRADGLMYYEEAAHLTEEEARAIRAEMRRLVQAVSSRSPGPDTRRYTLAALSIPDPQTDELGNIP